jgi:hypothetical protein
MVTSLGLSVLWILLMGTQVGIACNTLGRLILLFFLSKVGRDCLFVHIFLNIIPIMVAYLTLPILPDHDYSIQLADSDET